MNRREFALMSSLTLVAGAGTGGAKETLALGLLTDVHYADKKAGGSRHYRDSLEKGKEAAAFFRKRRPAAVVCLGDLIDAAPSVEVELGYLKTIAGVLDAADVPRYHVPGNHCVATLTKEEFFEHGGSVNRKGHHSFDQGGVHFVILDACFTAQMEPYGRNNFVWHDSNIPPAQLAWLEEDLKGTDLPVVVMIHQRLDLDRPNKYAVKQSGKVRKILEKSGKVRLVLQGHSHKNELTMVKDIPYCTLAAMVEGAGVENGAYSLLRFLDDGSIRLEGYRRQMNREFSQTER